jgi:phage repressor protein C with HTH and peptisase S24 domain
MVYRLSAMLQWDNRMKSLASRGQESRAETADPENSAFIRRLEQIASAFRSKAAFAQAAKIPASSLQTYFEGAEPNRLTLAALADAGNVSLEWLVRGRGYKEARPQIPDGYAAISFYDVRKAGGYVYPLIAQEVADFLYLKLDWFGYPDLDPGKLFVMEVTESRVPEIQERDLVMVDQSWRTKWSDPTAKIPHGIYLVSELAKLSIRRIVSSSKGLLKISRPDVPGKSERIEVGENGFTAHGRIIWYGRALPLS